MKSGLLKGIGAGCFVVAAILLFVAWERYDHNANQVEAANRMLSSGQFGGMMKEMTGGRRLEPATPESTKYALFFAAVAAIGGVVCLVAAFRKKEDGSRADYGPAP